MLCHVNCSCSPQFFFFLNLSVTCWLAVGRLSVTCRSTDGRQSTDSRPTGFLGSSSSQLPIFQLSCNGPALAVVHPRETSKILPGQKQLTYICTRGVCNLPYIKRAEFISHIPTWRLVTSPAVKCIYIAKKNWSVKKVIGY